MLPPLQTLDVDKDTRYSYYYSAPSQDAPTFLLLHGFPSAASDWHHQIQHLAAKGFGVVAPDLLGYGGSSKPADAAAYHWRHMCGHLVRLLNHVGLGGAGGSPPARVVVAGHDLGSWMASRLVHYHADRVAALAFVDVGYSAPGDRFDVDMINRMTAEMTGEAKFGYWDLLTAADGAALLDAHPESFLSLLYAADPHTMAQHMGPPGALRKWLTSDSRAALGDWLPAAEFEAKVAQFKSGGFAGPASWYRALRANVAFDDEQHMPRALGVPVLLLAAGRDEMTLADMQKQMTEPACGGGLDMHTLDTGHWVMLEAADEVSELLTAFGALVGKGAASA